MAFSGDFIVQTEIDGEKYRVLRDMPSYELLAVPMNIEMPAAVAGTLTTRTSTTVGTLTMSSASHGIQTGDKLDLYWLEGTDGDIGRSRRFLTVGTVSGTSVPFTLGTGDDLPDLNTIVTAHVPILQALPTIDFTTLVAWGAKFIESGSETTEQCTIVFGHGSFTEDVAVQFNRTGGAWNGVACWNNEHMEANPLTAGTAVTKCYVSHAGRKRAITFKFAGAVA